MAIFGGCSLSGVRLRTLPGPHADSADSNCWLFRLTIWLKFRRAGTFCPQTRNARTTGSPAHLTLQTDFMAARNNPWPHTVRSRGPEAEGNEVPGSNEDGDHAACQGNEQGMNAGSLMNFVFGNENSQEQAIKR